MLGRNKSQKMKYLLILVLSFNFLQIYAQEKFVPQTTIGINQRLNISLIDFNPKINQNRAFGYHAGLVIRHISEPNLGLQVELNFSQKGWIGKLDPINNYSRKLSYLELPFMTNITIGKKKTKILINFGPAVSYLVGDQIKSSNEESSSRPFLEKIDNKFEFNLCFGSGISRKTSIGIFQIEGRYNQSLMNLFNNSDEGDFLSSKNIVFSLGFIYLFELNSNK